MVSARGRFKEGLAAGLGGAVLVLAAAAWGGPAGPAAASAQAQPDRYDLVHGCYALRSLADGDYLAKAGAGYTASAAVGAAEPFRMQATDLGNYLLYGRDRDFLAISPLDPLPVVGGVESAAQPSGRADWTVAAEGDAFTLVNATASKQLAVNGSGQVVPAPLGAGESGAFAFEETTGCPEYPEVEVNATGGPATGQPAYGEVSGLLEGHIHGMAFEFLGGKAHCGRPWHRFGAPFALRDCPDHEIGDGCAAVLENVLYGNPARCHDPVGWPTFADWPDPRSLTHEQTYYKWLERAWRGGLRIWTNLMVENRVLCEVYPLKQNSCNEMDSVELQIQRIHELEDYIDAQSGGPGEGWFRIVRSPFEARKVINQGKLAVVMGMEVSEPFGCRVLQPNGIQNPQCTGADISSWLDELRELGIRQLEITNKFDNALTGVAGDSGTTGTLVNGANFLSTGSFWALDDNCEDPDNHDHSPTGIPEPHNTDTLLGNAVDELLSPGLAPVYPDAPLCNQLGLSPLGETAIRKIMENRMIFDPDHMSVKGRDQAMTVVESERYPGLISSHSWSTENTLPRIYRLGGVVTPYAGSSEDFVDQWSHLSDFYSGKQYFGVGYGADMNGFGSQGLPRGAGVPNPVTYPFESFDGKVTLDKQVSGQRAFDINVDGVAHYGLYPDWIEDLRMLAGDEIIEDMGRGAEAYLQMWERTEGIGRVRCAGWRSLDFDSHGLGKRVRLGAGPKETLTSAGQPTRRKRDWRWCANSAKPRADGVVAAFTPSSGVGLVLSRVTSNSAAGVNPGDEAKGLPAGARSLGEGVWVGAASGASSYVYVVGDGRVTHVGVAAADVAASRAALRRTLARVGVR